MFIPQHFWLTGSMKRIAEEEQSLNIYSGGNDLGGNTASHRLSPYEYALGLVSAGLDLFDNLFIASFKDLSLVRDFSSSFHVRKIELHSEVAFLGQPSVEIGDERRVHWSTRAMCNDQASLTDRRNGAVHNSGWYHKHCSRFYLDLFLANARGSSAFDVEDCLLDIMRMRGNNSCELDISHCELVTWFSL